MTTDKMENKKMDNDRKTHVMSSDPTSPPTAPSPTVGAPNDCPRECPQQDHVKVGGEAQQDIDDTKSDSSEPECFDIHDDDMTSPIEALSDYGPGGFHPVHLGDTLGPISDPSRFRVLHKLGHGGFGTVWLCRDTQDGKPKALKILSADASEKAARACPDFRALQLLTHSVSHEEGLSQYFPQALRAHETAQDLLRKHHIALPYEHFWLPYQPNGSHLCLIAPFLGPNLESFCATYGHVTDLVKHVCFQLVEAMHFLHQKGLCHGDFRPANILFCLNEEVGRMGDEELVDALGGVQMAKLTRTPLDNNNTNGAKEKERGWPKELPRYLVGQADMIKLIRGGWCSPSVAVIDFGVSYPVAEPTGKGTGIPLGYAPPEEAITGYNQEGKEETLVKLGPKSDVWSLGVTLAELALDYFPFADSSDKLYGVKNMELVMGPIPEPFRSEFRTWYKGVWGLDGTALQDVDMVTDPETGKLVLSPLSFSIKRWKEEKEYAKKESGYEDPIRSKMSLGLETLHTERSGAAIEAQWTRDKTKLPSYTWGQTEEEDEMDDDQFPTKKFDDIEVFSDLLRSIFKWMPEDRVSTAEIMAHPWFKDRYASSKDVKREGVVSRLSQGTFGIINFIAGFPFNAGKFFFSAFSRIFGIFSKPLWFLWRGRSCTNRSNDLEAQ